MLPERTRSPTYIVSHWVVLELRQPMAHRVEEGGQGPEVPARAVRRRLGPKNRRARNGAGPSCVGAAGVQREAGYELPPVMLALASTETLRLT